MKLTSFRVVLRGLHLEPFHSKYFQRLLKQCEYLASLQFREAGGNKRISFEMAPPCGA